MRHRARRFALFACVAGVLVAVSAQERTQEYAASSNPHIRRFANVLKDSVWERPRIFVCWENATSARASETQKVRDAVTATWEKESAVRFVGWQQCAPENAGVRVRIDDSGPHTKGLGRSLDRTRDGMVLNFDFVKWSPSFASMKGFYIRAIAVHEFGHALGFAHEQNRSDAPGECQLRRQGTNGDLLLTPYDPRSVMNYCNPKYSNDAMLSQLDITAVRQLYGPPGPNAGAE